MRNRHVLGKGGLQRVWIPSCVRRFFFEAVPDRSNAVRTLSTETHAGTQDRLAGCRRQIDALDQRIVELFQQRARVVEEVGNIKREAHLPVTVPSREEQVVERAQELTKGGPLPPEAVGRIYQKLVEEMRNWEIKLDAGTPCANSR